MLALLGTLGLASGGLGAILLVARGVRALAGDLPADLRRPADLFLGGTAVAMAAMQLALLTDDFSLAYLAGNHASATPFPFDVATAWAALEGSILLWGLVLAGFVWLMARRFQTAPDALGSAAVAVGAAVGLFFIGLMLTVANPFEVCVEAGQRSCLASSAWPLSAAEAPADGPGPNPLLQNHLLMAVHPPMLYLGYVGLTVPFAYAIGALLTGEPGPEWLRRSHRATLVAWSFLTLGIVLGGWWAYEVLSWGGYWAWDPVENASLMPWLAATAFLHSGIVQQRKGMLQAWNFVLVIAAFSLTILGTFLTRSGTINSVHSFTQSAIGPALLGFLVVTVVGSFALFAARADMVASAPRLDSLVSREGSFLANNLILTVYGFVVLVGTTYPLLLEAFTGTQVGVGEPFFNRLAVPLSFALLLMIGIGPVTPWGSAKGSAVWVRTRAPALAGAAAAAGTALTITRNGWVVLTAGLGTFALASAVGLLYQRASRRSSKTGVGILTGLGEVVRADQGFWAGQLSHAGVVLVALGIAFAANLGQHAEVEMRPGDSVEFAGHTITYESPFSRQGQGKTTVGARMTVVSGDSLVGIMEPAINFFGDAAVGTPDVLYRPAGDLYLTLRGIPDDAATIGFDTSPLISLLWLGGFVTAAGGFWAMSARRARDREVVAQDA